MKIDITDTPDSDIYRNRLKNVIWFLFFLSLAGVAVGIGVFAIYFDTNPYQDLGDWALGLLVAASLGVTLFGNRLQAYKKLFPPQREKLAEMRTNHPAIDHYCAAVEQSGRRFIRAEYEACLEYAEKHSAVPFV